MSAGGPTAPRDVTADEQTLFNGLKADMEAKAGATFSAFEAKSVMTQTVAGTNYFAKISVGGDAFIHARVFKGLDGAASVAAVKTGKKDADALEYFEA